MGSSTVEKNLPSICNWILRDNSKCARGDFGGEEDENTLLHPPLIIALILSHPEAVV